MAGRRNYNFDAGLVLSDGGSAYTAAGFTQVGGAPVAIDMGGLQSTITLPAIADNVSLVLQQPRIDLVAVIYLNAATISGSNVYKLIVVGSNTVALNSGNVILGILEIGKGTAMDGTNMADSHNPAGAGKYPAGDQYELLFTNEQNGVPYEFLAMYVGGTFGSITFTSFLAPLLRISQS
jgi:hypothetical protein